MIWISSKVWERELMVPCGRIEEDEGEEETRCCTSRVGSMNLKWRSICDHMMWCGFSMALEFGIYGLWE